MKEKPITFSTPMVQAILRGEKTMTRRICKFQPGDKPGWAAYGPSLIKRDCRLRWYGENPNGSQHFADEWPREGFSLRYQVGDLLWVKEGVVTHASIPQVVGYVADGCTRTEHWEKLRNSRFMPKWAARIWIEVTAVKVERLQDISFEDAIAEGIQDCSDAPAKFSIPGPQYRFRDLWDSINGKGSWDLNPWVEAYTFRRVEK